ncbi:hypothetical protein F8279_10250 [Micromonospora sp. AMSO1212t]|uniref:hypothetical protein n=1 Tax=Micromonospora TaxID=1873 RepID=UPI00124B3F0D|nr:hypothetical protein [Micromonospora sp. AMSO1212t]KAB1907584.1 hypothetical protein F8279_10250 [Micromonospora sp. AMSO1212t]
MSAGSAPFFFMLLFVALSPFLITFQLTHLAHSSYRNKLWLLRDRLNDDLRRGRISRSAAARTIQALLEDQIEVAGRHTLKDTILAISIYEVDGGTSVFEEILRKDTPSGDKEKLSMYLRELRQATIQHLTWGSVAGWIVIPLFKAVSRILRALTSRNSKVAAERATVRAKQRQTDKPMRSIEGPRSVVAAGNVGGHAPLQERTLERAEEMKQKVERAEVEIMPEAAPNRRVRNAKERRMADLLRA